MTRDDVIRMAREAGFNVGCDAGGEYVAPQYLDSVGTLVRLANAAYAAGQSAEREARIKAQTELEQLREDMTKRAMLAEKEAYRRGVEAERAACAKLCDEYECHFGDDCANAIRARGEKGGA